MGNVLFVVWRESLEAVLIVGILRSFLLNSVHGTELGRLKRLPPSFASPANSGSPSFLLNSVHGAELGRVKNLSADLSAKPLRAMWAGVAVGIALSLLLAYTVLFVQ